MAKEFQMPMPPKLEKNFQNQQIFWDKNEIKNFAIDSTKNFFATEEKKVGEFIFVIF